MISASALILTIATYLAIRNSLWLYRVLKHKHEPVYAWEAKLNLARDAFVVIIFVYILSWGITVFRDWGLLDYVFAIMLTLNVLLCMTHAWIINRALDRKEQVK